MLVLTRLLRRLFSENGFDGLRIRDRPLSTPPQEPGDGTGEEDFDRLFEFTALSPSGDALVIGSRESYLARRIPTSCQGRCRSTDSQIAVADQQRKIYKFSGDQGLYELKSAHLV